MIQKIKESCYFLLNKANLVVTSVILGMTALTSSAFAQNPSVTLDVPDLGWENIGTQLMSALTPAIVAGIGIALSVWVVYACVKFFRRAAS